MLAELLAIRHAAVVGASERSFAGTIVQRNLSAHAWPGRISQVHPRSREVDGRPCAPSLSALDEAPDAIVVLVPATAVVGVLAEAESIGTRFAVVPGAGDADAGAVAAEIRAWLDEPGRRIRVVGPNCMGLIGMPERLPLYIGTAPRSLREGPCALISQSGAVVEAFATQGARIGFRLLLSTGNEAHLRCEDAIEHLLDEGRTRCLLLSLEGVAEPARFLRLLGRAADQDVRVAVLRAGSSERAREAALTHTGAISGDWELWARLARRQGAAVVRDLDALCEFGTIASAARQPRRTARGAAPVWIVTNSGGQGAQLADLVEQLGVLDLPRHDDAHLEAFGELFPQAGTPGNPCDLWGLADYRTAYPEGIAQIDRHAEEGATLVAAADASLHQGEEEGGLLACIVHAAAACRRLVPLHLAPLSAESHPLLAVAVEETGIASLRGGRAGLEALSAWLAATGPRLSEQDLAEAGRLPAPGARLAHDDALALLASSGVDVPGTAQAASAAELATASAGLRAPLVLKAVGPSHRARVGGVRLGLRHDELADEAEAMALRVGAELRGFEVAEQVGADLELLVHVAADPQLGARATVAVGGALSEQARTACCDCAPRGLDDARALVERLCGAEAVGRPWADVVAGVLVRLSDAVRSGAAGEIEINPLAVDRLAARAWAVDVLAAAGSSERPERV